MANNFQPSQKLIDLMLSYESFRSNAYQHVNDVPTIGYGHTGPDVYLGMPPIDEAQARILFNQDLQNRVNVINAIQAPLTQNQFDALLDLSSNAGVGLFVPGNPKE